MRWKDLTIQRSMGEELNLLRIVLKEQRAAPAVEGIIRHESRVKGNDHS